MTCCAMDVLSMIRHSLVADGVNPITKYYQLGKHVASAGPEMLWKIYDAIRIIDKQEASVFIFEKRIADKLHKPRRREMVCEILRKEVEELDRFKHPRILQVWHKIEECHDSLAFATEPVRGSLANFLGNYERMPANVPSEIKDYTFLDIELKFGVLQIAESLAYLHMTELMLHRNICPESIIINRRGMWKVTGLGFSEKLRDGQEKFQSMPWSAKLPKMAQPDLDFIAPEVQIGGKPCSFSCDMFALGMLICAIYNCGRSLIQASHNPALYTKKIDQITELFDEVAHKMPLPLVEPVEKMINRDVRYRPSAQSFVQMKYFSEDAVIKCLQYLHFIESKDLSLKCELYTLLTQTIPYFPKKILYQFVFPYLRDELNSADMLVLVLPALVSLINHASNEEYCTIIKPVFGKVFSMTRPVQATVYLLEHIDLILSKTSDEEIKQDVLPMIFNTLESNSIQGQEAALNTFSIIRDYLNDQTMKKLVLPKAKGLYHKSMDVRVRVNALTCIDRLLDSLDKMIILDEVIPFLTEIQCGDVDIIMAVIAIYKHLLSDRKFGLTHNLLATKVMPTLIPHTVSPGLAMEQFSTLMEVLREMLDQIDRQRRNKMKMETADLVCTPEAMSKPSLNMRHNVHDGTRFERKMSAYEILCNKNLLSVEDAFKARTAPSTPEMLARTSQYANEMMCSRLTRRHSSVGPCQGLLANMGQEGDAIVEKFVRERRSSLVPGASLNNPMILVSEPSLPNLEESLLQPVPRRASTQSEPGRRDSRGRLLDSVNQGGSRRPSFQGLGESVMHLFGAK